LPELKRPISVLVLLHDSDLNVLLIKRATEPSFWQSVTGSLEAGETPAAAAEREVFEETGISPGQRLVDWHYQNTYAIFPAFRHRYPEGITHNTEHVFACCIERNSVIVLNPSEHTAHQWLPWQAASAACLSWSNQAAIEQLPLRYSR
jgi:dihydroneopterin triphosphate diphosphatase